jgi:hypothetical protein
LQLIGVTLVFCRFVYRLVVMPKLSRMDFRLLALGTVTFKKMTVSSA